MNLFTDLDLETQRTLDGVPEDVGMLPMLGFDAKGKGKEALVRRLRNLVEEDTEMDWEYTLDSEAVDNAQVADRNLKRKR